MTIPYRARTLDDVAESGVYSYVGGGRRYRLK
jgi:hypothetical protein